MHRLYEQYCRLDELYDWEPELAKLIEEKGYIFQEGVKYKLNEDKMVLKIDAHLCAYPEPSNPSITEPSKEKHKARVFGPKPNQTRLSELTK